MKPQIPISISLTLILAALNGSIALAQRKPHDQSTPQPIAQIIEARNRVQIRSEQSSPRTARVGDTLYMGDLVIVAKGSRGVIRCTSNLTTWTIPDDGLPRGVANTCSPRRS